MANGPGEKYTPLSHGLPGRCFVFEGRAFRCIQCGSDLVDNLKDRRLVHCINRECSHHGWMLLRPDLASCEIISKPEGGLSDGK